MKQKQWAGKTDGNKWMQESLVVLFRICNIRIFYWIMAVVILFYMVFNHKGYISIYRFFRFRLGYSPVRSFLHVYQNHYVFGQTILDKFAMYAGKQFQIVIEGQETLNSMLSGDSAFLMLSAHVGNYEIAGYSLRSFKKKIYAVVYAGETETIMKNRNLKFQPHNIHMISVNSDMSHLFMINDALSNGNVVSISADRAFGSSKVLACKFMGKDAKFPLGPFALAIHRNVPVLSVFVMKESVKQYRIYIHKIDVPNTDVPSAKKELLCNAFVNDLEKIVCKYPNQWFNYYDFWE